MDHALTRLQAGLVESMAVKQAMLDDRPLLQTLLQLAERIVRSLREGGRVLWAGNGGSAADAQHLAAEFVSRFAFDRPGLPALSLATDTSMLTAIGNDYGYEQLFRRQLQAQARPGDVFVGITTSGRSPNVLAAFDACPALGVHAVALCGLGGELEGRVQTLLRVPSRHTARIQEAHITLGHLLCAEVELRMFPEQAAAAAERH